MKRLPLSTAMLYLAFGYALGPQGVGFFEIDLIRQAAFLERVTEIAVIVSLFTAGLKLRIPISLIHAGGVRLCVWLSYP